MQPETEAQRLDMAVPRRTIFVIHIPVNKIENINGTWYTNFLGSWESMAFGEEKPWDEGDVIKITFEKVNRDRPTGTTETSTG